MKAPDVKKSERGVYIVIFEEGDLKMVTIDPSNHFAGHNTNWARKKARSLDEMHREPMDVYTEEDFDRLAEISVEPEEESNAAETEETVDQETDTATSAETILTLSDGPDFPAE